MTKRADIRHQLRSQMSEADIQAAFVKWAQCRSRELPELELLYAIPNGARRSRWEQVQNKRIGLKAGVPDMHLPAPRHGQHGLWLEFKSATGRLTPEQKRCIHDLRVRNHRVEVVRCWMAAANIVLEYLGREAEFKTE